MANPMTEQHGEDRPQRKERRDAAANRQQILAAARELFAVQGVDATSMEDIGRAAGVGKGTLYRRYAHKGELCEALLNEDIAHFYARAEAILSQAEGQPSPLAQLDRLLGEYVAMVRLHIPLLAAIQDSATGPRRKSFYQSPLYRWLHERIAGLLAAAMAAGEAITIDELFAADAILAAVAPPLLRFQQDERGFSTERILGAARGLFIDALRKRPPGA